MAAGRRGGEARCWPGGAAAGRRVGGGHCRGGPPPPGRFFPFFVLFLFLFFIQKSFVFELLFFGCKCFFEVFQFISQNFFFQIFLYFFIYPKNLEIFLYLFKFFVENFSISLIFVLNFFELFLPENDKSLLKMKKKYMSEDRS